MISETKLDHTFPTGQFLLDEFKKPYRLDRCAKGGGLLLIVRDDISSRLLTEYKTPTNVECIFVEISIRKRIGYFGATTTLVKVISLLVCTI